ncbi:hypothetical protein SAMN05216389_1388 [Oceanobacillus limi]|uniref:Uncharacterized protein n=1 Tax=Oceanobacillus limi TaxID=930131 RepID=A0A1I0HKH3_9BACI|nr:hypothetical protein [Oceanobacillus limi]SET84371.1 hypothetical protein SAMN05216389_1388 [Oceanobacillus limi]
MDEQIKKFIAYPMAIKVLKDDLEKFEDFRLRNVYLDMLESIIERMQKDFYRLKGKMHNVRKNEDGTYNINGQVHQFTAEELKEMTEELMSEYLHGDKAKPFERKERVWKKD